MRLFSESTDNGLNFQVSQTQRIERTHSGMSRVSCLPKEARKSEYDRYNFYYCFLLSRIGEYTVSSPTSPLYGLLTWTEMSQFVCQSVRNAWRTFEKQSIFLSLLLDIAHACAEGSSFIDYLTFWLTITRPVCCCRTRKQLLKSKVVKLSFKRRSWNWRIFRGFLAMQSVESKICLVFCWRCPFSTTWLNMQARATQTFHTFSTWRWAGAWKEKTFFLLFLPSFHTLGQGAWNFRNSHSHLARSR